MKLQMLCSARLVTGGAEAMHQLAHMARRLGADASMVYIDSKGQVASIPTPTAYAIYGVPVELSIADTSGSLLVVAETATHLLRDIRHARQAVWWLSVDNYFADLKQRRKKRFRWWTGLRPIALDRPDRALHLAQSAYASDFLARHGRPGAMMLTDYLRDDFIEQTAQAASPVRLRRVAYNPLKGIETTQLLLSRASADIQFVRLEKMSPAQVIETLRSSAVYIDFGQHPGRDRFPREAALCGCCIVTGMRGSAAFERDVPIPSQYKIDESRSDFAQTASQVIEQLVRDPGKYTHDFDSYRRIVVQQKQQFEAEVSAMLHALAHAPASLTL